MAQAAEVFVGRRAETDLLRSALDDARAGHGRLVLIEGEPGIGKTRLALELAQQAAGQGIRSIWGRCPEDTAAPPYWPWAQILRALAEPLTDDQLRHGLGASGPEIAGIVPNIAARLPDLTPLSGEMDPSESRFRLFSAITRFLTEAAEPRSLLLILDDLHWADAPSLRLLEFLAPELADGRLLILGTFRETDLNRRHRLSDTLAALSRVPHVERLTLAGLAEDDVRRFVAATAGIVPPASVTGVIHGQTQGNPLFVREMVRLLARTGDLTSAAATIPARLPEGVREVIGRRLNLLSPGCNAVLATASVIGRGFSLAVLRRASLPAPEDDVLGALDEALESRIIEETGEETWQFTHALVRMTLYDELRVTERRRLHHTVAEAIEAAHRRDPDAVAADLARHFRASGRESDVPRAVDHALVAARRAERVLAFEDAFAFCQDALDLMDRSGLDDPRRRCALLLVLGDARRKADDLTGAMDILNAGLSIARANGLGTEFADLALAYAMSRIRYAYSLSSSDPHDVLNAVDPLLDEALERLPDTATAQRIRILGHKARIRTLAGILTESVDLASRAVAMARTLGDPRALSASLYALILASGHDLGDAARQLSLLTDLTEAATRASEPEYASFGYIRMAELHLEQGRLTLAVAAVERIQARGVYQAGRLALTAGLTLLHGQLVEAERIIGRVLGMVHPDSREESPMALLIFGLRREQGRLRELAPLVAAFARDQDATSTWGPGLALMWLALDEKKAAHEVFERLAADDFVTLPRDGRLIANLVFLAEVCAALGDRARAEPLYSLLLPWSGHIAVLRTGAACWGAADRFLGLLAATMGDRAKARDHFDRALTMGERIEAWLSIAHTHCDYAAFLLDDGDSDAATPHIDAAAEAAERLGLAAVAQRVAALRERDAAPAAAAAAVTLDNLTERELEVLKLMAIGRANPDIALVLEISRATVATHVRNILAKTGCANRTEASAYAARHGLMAGLP